jgi:hypothetical protein
VGERSERSRRVAELGELAVGTCELSGVLSHAVDLGEGLQLGLKVLAVTDIRTMSIARGRAIKRVNALTAVPCGALPAVALGIFLPTGSWKWSAGLVAGLLWATWFEYAYHRFLLHLPGTFFPRPHLEHHASVGTPTEAEHVNFGSSPVWVVALFAINGVPMVAVNLLLRLRMAPGILLAFAVYYIVVEEVH